MLVRRSWTALAVVLAFVACEDTAGPVNDRAVPGPQLRWSAAAQTRILRQSPSVPPLEAYSVSFWAFVGKASAVQVRYQPAGGQALGDPFLRFEVPKHALATRADGTRLQRGDSVYITVTIDAVSLDVHFEPSGVSFSKVWPAALTIWYGNANPDVNGDGVVDATDQTLTRQLAVWSQSRKTQRWHKLASKNNARREFVAAPLYHFSEYAVCW